MYKILIADGDARVVEELKAVIEKYFGALCEIRTAMSGRTAVEAAQEFSPHILLIDIRMQGINGLDAAKEILSFRRDVAVVIISAYDRFSYAVQALKLGARSYILKPFTADGMRKALKEVMCHVDRLKQRRSENLMLKEQMHTFTPLAGSALINLILLRQEDTQEMEHLRRFLGIKGRYGRLCFLSAPDEPDREVLGGAGERTGACSQYLKEMIGEFFPQSVTGSFANRRIPFLLPLARRQSETKERPELADTARNMLQKLHRLRDGYRIGIGTVYEIGELHRSGEEAQRALDFGREAVSFGEDLKVQEGHDKEYLEAAKRSAGRDRDLMEQAKRYIRQRFDRKELSLDEVAGQVRISSYYFSKLFKRAVGKSFTDYVRTLRIEKAGQLLLCGQYSVKEVCLLSGYSDPNYFCRIFKRMQGCTPTEYREVGIHP